MQSAAPISIERLYKVRETVNRALRGTERKTLRVRRKSDMSPTTRKTSMAYFLADKQIVALHSLRLTLYHTYLAPRPLDFPI